MRVCIREKCQEVLVNKVGLPSPPLLPSPSSSQAPSLFANFKVFDLGPRKITRERGRESEEGEREEEERRERRVAQDFKLK